MYMQVFQLQKLYRKQPLKRDFYENKMILIKVCLH